MREIPTAKESKIIHKYLFISVLSYILSHMAPLLCFLSSATLGLRVRERVPGGFWGWSTPTWRFRPLLGNPATTPSLCNLFIAKEYSKKTETRAGGIRTRHFRWDSALTFPVGSAISQLLTMHFHQNDLLPISLPQKAISYQMITDRGIKAE